VALRELSRHEILQAVAEYDRLGQDSFLEKYGFGTARSYWLMVDGKTYDSKAIVGAAHGFLPGQESLAAADFSGGAATMGRLLAAPARLAELSVGAVDHARAFSWERTASGLIGVYRSAVEANHAAQAATVGVPLQLDGARLW